MKVHRAIVGDCIASIAFEHGFFPDTLWDHPDNAKLKQLRENPNVLAPGDEVVIPEMRLREEHVDTGRRHVFVRKGVPEKLRFQLRKSGEPRARIPYELMVDGVTMRGETDAEGNIERWISPVARTAVLKVSEQEQYHFDLGQLEPLSCEAGLRERLRSLGYLDERNLLSDAIGRFQSEHDLRATGEMDQETRDKLHEVYGV